MVLVESLAARAKIELLSAQKPYIITQLMPTGRESDLSVGAL